MNIIFWKTLCRKKISYQTDITTDHHQKSNYAQVHSYPNLTALMIIGSVLIPLEKNQSLFVSTCKIYYFLNITAHCILLNPLKHEHDAKLNITANCAQLRKMKDNTPD
jgi:hypothetical protein